MVLRRQMFNQNTQQQQQQQQQPTSAQKQEEGKMEVEDEFGTTIIDGDQSECEAQPKQGEKNANHHYMMFLTDKVPSFYRRLHSSTDGLFTLFPCCRKCDVKTHSSIIIFYKSYSSFSIH